MVDKRILYTKPSITDLEVKYAQDAAKNGWGDKCYEYINKFEKSFSEHIGSQYAIATSSCTGAYHMGLHALGIKKDDEIILADTNWIATLSPIVHLGAKPVFVDIDPKTWCINPDKIIEKINSKTKAIVATHIYGNLCDMDSLTEIAKKYNLHLIEDAAEAIGSKYKNKSAGSMGCFSTFSFHGTKTMTTGEGGMFLTNNEEIYNNVLTLSNHGRSANSTKQFWPDKYGFKYKMSNIQAAIGLAQLERVQELVQKKKYIFEFYSKELCNITGLSMNFVDSHNVGGFWMPNLVFEEQLDVSREKAFDEFKKNNIDARVFFWPLSSLPMINTDLSASNFNSYDIASRSINLPSYHDMTDSQLMRVVNVVKEIIN